MKKTISFFYLILSIVISLRAQDTAYLDIANVRALANSNGTLFQDNYFLRASFEVPKGSDIYSIYSSCLWMLNKESFINKEVYSGSYETYGDIINDPIGGYNVGPVDLINQKADTSPTFQRLWKINRSDIDYHIQNWNNPNYTAAASIIDWPGNGNSNTAQNLAPYADLDNDNIYEPYNGEYPIIKGDQAVFLIFNDYKNTFLDVRSDSNDFRPDTLIKQSANLEIHMMLYAYSSQKQAISNTVFANIKILNRSKSANADLNDLRISVWTDFDLGHPFDDYVGTDTLRDMVYAYNGDGFDENTSGINGYGNQLASQGIKFLNVGLFSSLYYNNSLSTNGNPTEFMHYINYQRSLWKNGSPVYYGGNGYDYCIDTNQTTRYMYNGDPSLINDTSQWTESNPCLSSANFGNAPGDRRMLATADLPSQLKHGDTLVMDYAYIFARSQDSSNHISDPVAKLFLVADTVQDFYDANIVTGMDEYRKVVNTADFHLYPNPSSGMVNIQLESDEFNIAVYDLNGRLIKEIHNESQFSVEDMNNGIYLVQLEVGEKLMSRKLVVQH